MCLPLITNKCPPLASRNVKNIEIFPYLTPSEKSEKDVPSEIQTDYTSVSIWSSSVASIHEKTNLKVRTHFFSQVAPISIMACELRIILIAFNQIKLQKFWEI